MLTFKLLILSILIIYLIFGFLFIMNHKKLQLHWIIKGMLLLQYLLIFFILLFLLLFGVNTP